MIRPARPDDQPSIEAIVRAAYEKYIERIGKPPGPMLDDYGKLIADGMVNVLTELNDRVAALIVLLPEADHVLLDNIAVHPDRQGRGFGLDLMAFAEIEARRRGFSELRLYTHVTMTENIGLYRRLGFIETARGEQAGYERVFMRKGLDNAKPFFSAAARTGDWHVAVDRDATIAAYRLTELGGSAKCGCDYCRNFQLARNQVFPAGFLQLLDELGIDAAKDGEVYHNGRLAPGRHNYAGWFHFIGTLGLGAARDHGLIELTSDFRIWVCAGTAPRLTALRGLPAVQLEFMAEAVPWLLQTVPEPQ